MEWKPYLPPRSGHETREAIYLANALRLASAFVVEGELPLEYDAAFYRRAQADLSALFSDSQLREHYEAFARDEGRMASPAAHRDGLLSAINKEGKVLEIGPFCSPLLKGSTVRYFDVLDREGLVRRAESKGLPTAGVPDHIDFVSPNGDLAIVSEKFESVVSSHVIEHQPDLLRHLREIGRIVGPQGRYYLIIPDRRYCLDQSLPETTFGEVLQASQEGRVVHTLNSVVEHIAYTTHSNTIEHWRGNHEDPNADCRLERLEMANAIYAEAAGMYLDVHAWKFDPKSFRMVVATAHRLGLSPFKVERVYDTVYGCNEFTAVLQYASDAKE